MRLSGNHPSLKKDYSPGDTPDTQAHNWSDISSGPTGLTPQKEWITDSYGRAYYSPVQSPVNHDSTAFPRDHRSVTFVGRPFPLEEAPQHFARLRRWGLTFIRLNVTWEAIEHAGPGDYDTEYLDYLKKLLSLLPEFGLVAFVSLHQDVWSRYSGGSGAPAWTLELAGFDLEKIGGACGAAYLSGVQGNDVEIDRGRWPTGERSVTIEKVVSVSYDYGSSGYQKLAASTMATLFWSGNTFAPKLRVKSRTSGETVNIQDFLQDHFLDAFDQLVRAVGDCEGVVGFELMNEPHRGYVSVPSLHSFDYNTDLHLHDTPNALQSFALGAGHAEGVKAWREDGPTEGRCIWEKHGVWGWDVKKHEPVPLREGYFKKHPDTGEEIEWHGDFFYPFVKRWAARVHELTGNRKMVFLEAIPNEFCPASWTSENQPHNMVFAPHWYDLNALFSKAFGFMSVNVQGLSRGMFILSALYWGHAGVRENYALQIRNIVENGRKSLSSSRPTIIGECGIPMDMNNGAGFTVKEYKWHLRMMDALMTALERNLIGFTLWNYNPSNDDTHGDSWNGENFSWFSQSRADSNLSSTGALAQSNKALDTGARLLPVLVRPYPAKIAGIPMKFNYEPADGSFKFVFKAVDPSRLKSMRARETEVFLPAELASGRKLLVDSEGSNLEWSYDPERQTLFVVHSGEGVRTLMVSLDPPLNNKSVKPTPDWVKFLMLWFGLWLSLFVVTLMSWR
ncbi:putative glycosyl hydrolase YIR007W [Rhizoctonia solani AG-1 IB]|uniref:Putative glycosyl hydrolase YIR007W n=1 Tax=Thanatephorus cucumeris (strain AG1-IB / isolate 7/3/14) TaxID=1108050 RepID=M5CA74_THACB|nr:putative glycosyl hydrolase YIR007W [Rhizoctonia solani AG-1 IB]